METRQTFSDILFLSGAGRYFFSESIISNSLLYSPSQEKYMLVFSPAKFMNCKHGKAAHKATVMRVHAVQAFCLLNRSKSAK